MGGNREQQRDKNTWWRSSKNAFQTPDIERELSKEIKQGYSKVTKIIMGS